MIRLFACFAVLVSLVSTARAELAPGDISISAFNPEDAVAPSSTVEGPGIKVGEGTVLRPVFGVETGFVSNVFYDESNPTSAGLVRLLAQIAASSLGAARLTAPEAAPADDTEQVQGGSFEYRASMRASYDLMLSGNNTVSDTSGLGLGATLHGMVNPLGRLTFGVDEDYSRLIRATNFESSANTNRDINNLRLLLLYHPRDRAISGFLYYTNQLDIFERNAQRFADRMTNRVGVHPMWRFFPQTQAYVDLSIANVTGLGSSQKSSSFPLVARTGIATLLNINTTLNLDAGYTNGFYAKGPSFSAPVIGALIGYRYSPLGRATLGYTLQYEDSINANFYRDHILHASLQQLFNPFVVMIQPEVHFRQYTGVQTAIPSIMGPATRDDTILALVAGVHYTFRNWIAATLNYKFTSVQTNYRYTSGPGVADDPSFVRHELLIGMRVAL